MLIRSMRRVRIGQLNAIAPGDQRVNALGASFPIEAFLLERNRNEKHVLEEQATPTDMVLKLCERLQARMREVSPTIDGSVLPAFVDLNFEVHGDSSLRLSSIQPFGLPTNRENVRRILRPDCQGLARGSF